MQYKGGERALIASMEAGVILPEGVTPSQSMGSIFHGHLIECLDSAWADKMHEQSLRPYSQYITWSADSIIWHVNVLNEEAFENILVPLMKHTTFHSEHNDYDIELSEFTITKNISYENLEAAAWKEQRQLHDVKVEFLSPTSFKTNGTYAIFPFPELMLNSLIRKWNTFSDASILEEQDLAKHIASVIEITDYNLHMQPFYVEGQRIRAFRGAASFGRFHTDAAMRMTAMLLNYAEFAGIGIKTALGMGGIRSHVQIMK